VSGTIKPLGAKQVQRLRELMVDSADAPVNSVYKSRGRSRIIGTGNVQSARVILHQQDEIDRLRRYRDSIGEALKDGRKLRGTGEPARSDVQEIEDMKEDLEAFGPEPLHYVRRDREIGGVVWRHCWGAGVVSTHGTPDAAADSVWDAIVRERERNEARVEVENLRSELTLAIGESERPGNCVFCHTCTDMLDDDGRSVHHTDCMVLSARHAITRENGER